MSKVNRAERVLRGGWLTLNRNCNMRCGHCYQKDTEFDPKRNMDLKLADKLIDLFIEAGAINVVLIGGEPTIYKDLIYIIKRLVSGSINPILITNGRSLSNIEVVKSLKDAGLINVNISIKADSEAGYQYVTGTNGSFSLVKKAINNILIEGLELGVSVTIEEYFTLNTEEYLNMLLSLHVPHINFDMGSPVLMESSVDVTGIPNPFQLAKTMEVIHNRLKNTSQSYGFYVTVPLCIIDPVVKNELISKKRITTSCHVAKGKASIFTEDGSVVPCNHFTGQKFGKYGEEFSGMESFRTFWRSEELEQFRRDFNSHPHENCINCLDWNICGGGCKIKWMYYDPKDFIGKRR